LSGKGTSWKIHVLLAEAEMITPQPGGRGFIIGDRDYYLDVPADNILAPAVRTRNGRRQLTVAIPGCNVDRTLTYTLVW